MSSNWKDFAMQNPGRIRGDWAPRADASSQDEEAAQAAVVGWCRTPRTLAVMPEAALIRHFPNGGHRHASVGAKMRAAGTVAGTPDLFLPVPRQRGGDAFHSGWWHGLWIEMKAGTNDLSVLQYEQLCLLRLQGYATDTAHSAEQAIALITEYLTDSTAFVAGY